jgi:sugar phosphate isomerase/epimerase
MREIGITTKCGCGKCLDETLTNIKNAGFKNVMVDATNRNLENCIKSALALGLKIPFVHLDSRDANFLWGGDEHAEIFVGQIIRDIEICAKYKIETAVLHLETGELSVEPNMNAVRRMNKIIRAAEIQGVKIAVENGNYLAHDFYIFFKIKSPNLGFCYDCGHHYLLNPETDLLNRYGVRLFAVHLHDNLLDKSGDVAWAGDLHYLPMDGKIDFKRVMKQIGQSVYNGVLMLESTRESYCAPYIYKDLSPSEFLKRAYECGKMLIKTDGEMCI